MDEQKTISQEERDFALKGLSDIGFKSPDEKEILGFLDENPFTRNTPTIDPVETEANNIIDQNTTDTSFFSSSAPVVQQERDTSETVSRLTPPSTGEADAISASEKALQLIDEQISALESRRQSEVEGITRQFDEAKVGLKEEQKKEAGAFRSTLTRAGGFLGASASGTGALLNLAKTHRSELAALESKKAAAISEAQSAIDDKQFALARMKVEEVKDIEKTINQRKQDFFDNTLKVTQEERKQDEFLQSKFRDDLELLGSASLSGDEIDPGRLDAIDRFYGVRGFASRYLDVISAQTRAKTEKDAIDVKSKMLNFLQDIPQGQKIVFPDGTEYTGMGSAGDVSTYMQVDDSGFGRIISHNKLTNQTTVTAVGNVGKTKSEGDDGFNGIPKETVFDNVTALMSIELENTKDPETGAYDPDIYLELRKDLKNQFPTLINDVDRLFLNPTNDIFSRDAVERLREKGVFTDDRRFF